MKDNNIVPNNSSPESQEVSHRSGFVALVGRPNSGKSTLLNTILGEELALVSNLPQTTRTLLRGICTCKNMQVVFVDTPGIHFGKHEFNRCLSNSGLSILKKKDVDVVCYLIDLSREFGQEEDSIATAVADSGIKILRLFNKKDMCTDTEKKIAEFDCRYSKLGDTAWLCIEALQPQTKEIVLNALGPLLPFGPPLFPQDDLTDSNMRYFAAEAIRKQIIHFCREEVPHAAFIEIVSYKETPNSHIIDANIHVETRGQRGIIIGKNGSLINTIRSKAAADIEKLAGVTVKLACHVKVTPKWRDNQRFLKEMGIYHK